MYPEIHYQIEESRQSGGARTATVFGCYGVSPEILLMCDKEVIEV